MKPSHIATMVGVAMAAVGTYFAVRSDALLNETDTVNETSRLGLLEDAKLLNNGRRPDENLKYLRDNPAYFRRAILMREDKLELTLDHPFMLAALAEHIRYNPFGDLFVECDFIRYINAHPDALNIRSALRRAQAAMNGPLKKDYPHAVCVAGDFVRKFTK